MTLTQIAKGTIAAGMRNRRLRNALAAASRRGMLPSWVFTRLPITETFVVPLPAGAAFRYCAIPTDPIGRYLFWSGVRYFEPETTGVFLKLARRARVVLDIGANTGVYTLLACAAGDARVLSFEPVPRNCELLSANLRANGWESRCEARREAVCNVTGRADLRVPCVEVPDTASLCENITADVAFDIVNVATVTIDSVCAETDPVDLVKIDVEGAEATVIEGMRRVLSTSRPAVIVECLPDGPIKPIERMMRGHGYRAFHLTRQGPVRVEKVRPDPLGHCRNFLWTVGEDWSEMHG